MFGFTTHPMIYRPRIPSTILVICFLVIALFPVSFRAVWAKSPNDIVKPKQIYTYDIMTRDIQALANKYPDLIQYRSVGKSEYNRNLWVIEVGHGPINVLLNGSHHAREWISTILLMEMTEQIAINEYNDAKWGNYQIRDLLEHITFQIVPMVNPDGVTLQQKGLAAFPKQDHAALLKMNGNSSNFKRWKANAKGIDLNRQYPADWENIKNQAPAPHYMNYKGKTPLQAKEAKAMFDLALSVKPAIAVSYHSSGEIVYWNYKTPADHLQRDLSLATTYSNMTGYRLIKPVSQPSGGGFTDWFIQEFGQPGLTPELSPAIGERDVPYSNWDRIWKQNEDAAWLFGTTAVINEMDKLQPQEAIGWIELRKEATAYEYPVLSVRTFGKLPIGNYEITRSKGDWLEIKSDEGHLRWISDRNSRRLSAEEIVVLLELSVKEPQETEEPEQSADPVPPSEVEVR
ncbi:M14 family zinc carboxypeptidase [Cohnella sp. WQ 127256]|uniref:M14 family zinc carboxypeptidase n=1 Tax=Cohnella sp. WQ 127256 TaxID=2938790 RepID=UPI00211812F4|nr:M14 family zinc carboxypeptidase [Cohnella sp. WQ 127256]